MIIAFLQLNTHPFNGPFPGLPRWAGTRKVKPIWILLKQETVSSSGISWAMCKSAPRSRQITTPAPHHSVFTVWMPFLPPNQQRQSCEGTIMIILNNNDNFWLIWNEKLCTFKIVKSSFLCLCPSHGTKAFCFRVVWPSVQCALCAQAEAFADHLAVDF